MVESSCAKYRRISHPFCCSLRWSLRKTGCVPSEAKSCAAFHDTRSAISMTQKLLASADCDSRFDRFSLRRPTWRTLSDLTPSGPPPEASLGTKHASSDRRHFLSRRRSAAASRSTL
ncbi:hypothetical protein NL676_031049 [Syzygium grande]|nr:hypothetical protein NL676_031049 [Syzygium grande]